MEGGFFDFISRENFEKQLSEVCLKSIEESKIEDAQKDPTTGVRLDIYAKGLGEKLINLDGRNTADRRFPWLTDTPYIVKDKTKLAETIMNTTFFSLLLTECRRCVSDIVSSVPCTVDFLGWIFLCSLPLDGNIPPAVQYCVNRMSGLILMLNNLGYSYALSMLDRELVRQLQQLHPASFNDTDYRSGSFEVGPLPIIYVCRSSEFGGFKADMKVPVIHEDTEKIYKDNISRTQTFSEAVSKSDQKYKCRERNMASIKECDSVLSTSLLQNILTCDGYVQNSSITLGSGALYLRHAATPGSECIHMNLINYVNSLKNTFMWVQYIRAYAEGDKEECDRHSKIIISEYTWYEDKELMFNAQEEAMFYFDMIHQIINPVRNLPVVQ